MTGRATGLPLSKRRPFRCQAAERSNSWRGFPFWSNLDNHSVAEGRLLEARGGLLHLNNLVLNRVGPKPTLCNHDSSCERGPPSHPGERKLAAIYYQTVVLLHDKEARSKLKMLEFQRVVDFATSWCALQQRCHFFSSVQVVDSALNNSWCH